MRDTLEALEDEMELQVVHVLEEAPDGWQGATSLISEELLDEHLPDGAVRFSYFVCGPDDPCVAN